MFGLTVQQPAETLHANTFLNLASYLIHCLGNSTKLPSFCKFLLEKLES